HARLFGRLPRDARGDRDRERAYLQEIWRREFRGNTLPQRQRPGHAGDLANGATGAQGLGVSVRGGPVGPSAGTQDIVIVNGASADRSIRLALSVLFVLARPASCRKGSIDASTLVGTAKETSCGVAGRRPPP